LLHEGNEIPPPKLNDHIVSKLKTTNVFKSNQVIKKKTFFVRTMEVTATQPSKELMVPSLHKVNVPIVVRIGVGPIVVKIPLVVYI